MSAFRSEDVLVGLVALAAVPFVLRILHRGFRDGRLPIGKGKVLRDERPAAFRTLLILYILAAALMAFVGLDLLVGLNWRALR